MSAQLEEVPRIRQMLVKDLDAVVLIEREVFLFPWTKGNFGDSISSGYYCYVLEMGNHIFGYGVMTIGADEAHILTLSVASEWQREGWGEKLLHYFISLSKENNACSIFLEVRKSNLGAAKLYEQIGFRQVGARVGYYPAMGGREDAIVMELIL
ncbi:MAG: ribosomal protein S18-alanine N-acetyltransferase [Nitrosomonadaceae bacterium]|jgi:ribosomal-protein-alanine N-acetyltransferase|nr:ribosomal protein S18-alanine N-acetyltransferase [Nitrosomonadaceae bacterium]